MTCGVAGDRGSAHGGGVVDGLWRCRWVWSSAYGGSVADDLRCCRWVWCSAAGRDVPSADRSVLRCSASGAGVRQGGPDGSAVAGGVQVGCFGAFHWAALAIDGLAALFGWGCHAVRTVDFLSTTAACWSPRGSPRSVGGHGLAKPRSVGTHGLSEATFRRSPRSEAWPTFRTERTRGLGQSLRGDLGDPPHFYACWRFARSHSTANAIASAAGNSRESAAPTLPLWRVAVGS